MMLDRPRQLIRVAGSSSRNITAAPVTISQASEGKIPALPEAIHRRSNECVDPWSVEHLPNPVIFSHMRGAESPPTLDQGPPRLKIDTNSSESGDSSTSTGPLSSVPTSCTSRDSRARRSSSVEEKSSQNKARSLTQDIPSPVIESSSSASVSPTAAGTQPQLLNGDLTCNHCQLSFSTLGQMK